MKSYVTAAAALFCLAAPAFADGHASGDAENGEKVFKKCKSCHMVQDADGNTIVKGGKTGPNLYGLSGRTAGTADFKYSKDMIAAGEGGLAWDEEQFAAYVPDPTAFLKETTGNDKARSKMSKQRLKDGEAADIWAYLVSVGPES